MERIPSKYIPTVKTALVASAAVAPLGLLGGWDAAAIATIWTTMFLAIREKANSSLGKDPKRIALAVATGLIKYYIGCKAATFACFCIPGLGPVVAIVAAIGISGVCNIYFTYSFAAALIDLMNKNGYSDDDTIDTLIRLLKKLPNVDEIKEIAKIYRS